MKIKSVRPFRGKTAYAILGHIIKLILEEPKRYDQTHLLDIKGLPGKWETLADQVDMNFPACGTIGCVAGWTAALLSSRPHRLESQLEFARKKLGLSYDQENELFSEYALGNYYAEGPTPQTLAHARAGAKHIERFRKKYRAQLMAKKV